MHRQKGAKTLKNPKFIGFLGAVVAKCTKKTAKILVLYVYFFEIVFLKSEQTGEKQRKNEQTRENKLLYSLKKRNFSSWVKVTVVLWFKKSQPQDMEKVTTL